MSMTVHTVKTYDIRGRLTEFKQIIQLIPAIGLFDGIPVSNIKYSLRNSFHIEISAASDFPTLANRNSKLETHVTYIKTYEL